MARAGLNPEKVVAAAAVLVDDVGYDHLTLAALAQHFGVALPSLYKHVKGLDGLRRDLAVLGMAELADEMGRAAAGRTRGDALGAVAAAYRDFARRRPGLYAATLRAPAVGDLEHEAPARRALDTVYAVVAGYGLEGDDAVHAIRIVRAALHGFVTLDETGGFGMPQAVDESFRRMVAGLDAAVAAAAVSPA